jgi:hypothetical protein
MRRTLIAVIALAIAILLTSCLTTNTPPVIVQPPVTPVTCGLVVHVFRGAVPGIATEAEVRADHKVPGSLVIVAGRSVVADGAGNADTGRYAPGVYLVSVQADGFIGPVDVPVELCTVTSVNISLTQKPPIAGGRTGRVRLVGRAFADDAGPYLALGTSLMYGVHAASDPVDLERLRQNLTWAKDRGVDFVRVFAETEAWGVDSRTGPLSNPDWHAAALRTMREAAIAAGLRIEWTLFSSDKLNAEQESALVTTVLAVCVEQPSAVQFVEMSNENFGFNDGDGPTRMRAFAGRFVNAGYPTALTSVPHGAAGIYTGSFATLATEHFDRVLWENGWRPVRQPWGYWERSGVPGAFVNNEPIGIGSSVAQDTDPLRLVMGAVDAWISGSAATVVHTGAGIYGVPNVHRDGGSRPANLWEQPALEPTLVGIAAMRKILPPDVANWTRVNANKPGHPFAIADEAIGDKALRAGLGCDRAYSVNSGGRFVVTPIGIMGEVTLTPTAPIEWTVYHPLTGAILSTGSGALTLREAVEGRAVVILGSWK